jgi:hypothetical protein
MENMGFIMTMTIATYTPRSGGDHIPYNNKTDIIIPVVKSGAPEGQFNDVVINTTNLYTWISIHVGSFIILKH